MSMPFKKEQETDYKQIVDNLAEGIIVFDAEGTIVFTNNTVLKIFRIKKSDIIGRKFNDPFFKVKDINGKTLPGEDNPVKKVLDTKIPLYESEYSTEISPGQQVFVSMNLMPITDTKGALNQIIASFTDITERVKAEEALKKSESLFKNVLERIQMIAIILDTQGKLIFANNYFLKLTGWKKSEALGIDWFDNFIPPDNRNVIRQIFNTFMYQGQFPVHYENEILTKPGERRLILFNNTAIRENGKLKGVTSLGIDVTKQRITESKLKQSEQKFRKLFIEGPLAMAMVNKEMKFTEVNPMFAKLLRYKRRELEGKSFTDITLPEDIELSIKQANKILAGKTPFVKFDKRYMKKDGSIIWVRLTSSPIKDDEGKLLYLLSSFEDITEQKRIQKALIESENRHRQLVELSPDGIIVHSEGKIVFVNSAGAKIIGAKNPEELIGRPITNFIHPDSKKMTLSRISYMLKEKAAVPLTEDKFIKLNGETIDVEVSSTYLEYEGRPAIQTIARNITKRKQAEEELQFKSKALDNVIDSIFVVDLEGKILYLNETAYKTRGYKKEELLGKSIGLINTPENAALVEGRLAELKNTGMMRFDSEHIKKDGSRLPIEVHASLINFKGKKVALSINRDISERKKTEAALRESEEKYRYVIETAIDGIIQCSNGKIIYWNKGAERIFGYKSNEIKGKPVTGIMPKRHIQDHLKGVEKALLTGKSRIVGKTTYEIHGKRKDGTEVPLELSVSKATKNSNVLFTAILRDVSERKHAQEQLKQAYDTVSNIADTLQKGLLPSDIPRIKGLEIKTYYQATGEGEVGGDFFDVFETTNGFYGIIIGDVSGKGINVAAETARVKYLLRDRAFDGTSPPDVLCKVNNTLFRQKAVLFTAITYCLYNPKNSEIMISNAGNPYPYNAGNNRFLKLTGVPVSIFSGQKYEMTQHKMSKGDYIVFYTDGLVEARRGKLLFGENRVKRIIKTNTHLPLSSLLKKLVDEASHFSRGRLRDDILVLGLKKK